MDVYEIRKVNLRHLIADAGSVQAFAEKVGGNANWYSALQSTTSQITPSGRKNQMGPGIARKIESALQLPKGWMDTLHQISGEQRMWVDRFSELSKEDQEKALEYLQMLWERHKRSEDTEPNEEEDNGVID